MQSRTEYSWLRLAAVAFAVGLFAGCAHSQVAEEVPPVEPTAHMYRIADSASLHLYVFEPAGARGSARPAILLFHGGGWTMGSPEWTFGTARGFAEAGLVAIAVEYRLSGGQWTPLDALADVCESFRWVRRNASGLGIDPARVAGHGVSAGGHLLASTSTVGCPPGGEPMRPTPDVLLLWSPALDVTRDGWFARQLQGRAESKDVSPAHHVRATTPPTSIVHGDADTVTPLAGVAWYCEALNSFGVGCELNVYPRLGHLLTRNLTHQESDFDPDPDARADGRAKHLRFLRAHSF